MDYIVDITVKEIRGKGICPHGHEVDDVFHIGDRELCPWACHTLMLFVTALRYHLNPVQNIRNIAKSLIHIRIIITRVSTFISCI